MWRGLVVDGLGVTELLGPAAWRASAYGVGLILVNLVVFAWLFLRSPQRRWPAALMLTGQILLRDVTAQKQAQAQILEQQCALATLSEREHLARELHDDLGQALGYIKMQAQAARDRLAQGQATAADLNLAQLAPAAPGRKLARKPGSCRRCAVIKRIIERFSSRPGVPA